MLHHSCDTAAPAPKSFGLRQPAYSPAAHRLSELKPLIPSDGAISVPPSAPAASANAFRSQGTLSLLGQAPTERAGREAS